MKKITLLVVLITSFSTVFAQKDTSDLKTVITSNFPDNVAGFITPERLRNVSLDLMRSNANKLEDNIMTGKLQVNDSVKTLDAFYTWSGSAWEELGSLPSVWTRSGGFILPSTYTDKLSVDSARFGGVIYPNDATVNIGTSTVPFDTVFADVIVGVDGNSLDQAYDSGGPGAGRTINADAGAFNVNGSFNMIDTIGQAVGAYVAASSGSVAIGVINAGATVENGIGIDIDEVTAKLRYPSSNFQVQDSLDNDIFVIGREGTMKFVDGNQAAGYVLTSDASGNANWQANDPGTGWASYNDDSYTSGSPFVITAADTAKIPFFWTSAVTPQLPTGVDSLFNRADTTIRGFNGDAYTIRISFIAQTSSVSGYGVLLLDIGNGTPVIISEQVFTFPKGSGTDHPFSFTTSLFAGSTFESYGCQVKIRAGTGDISMHDFNYVITRTHKAK